MAQETDSLAMKKFNKLRSATIVKDTSLLSSPKDSLIKSDSIPTAIPTLKISKDAVSSPVDYYAKDSITFDLKNKKSFLYDEVKVNYEDIDLTSNYMEIDFENNELFAKGSTDSLGELQGNPVFKQNETEFKSHGIRYNFTSKKGLVTNVITQESDGFLHGEVVKRMDNNVSYVSRGMFTTCNLDHPHYGFTFKKAKVIPDDKIVTGPIQLHIADVPTPLAAPFAMIPNQKGHKNGILIPSYGESAELGFYFKGIGVYFAFKDKVDISLTGVYIPVVPCN
jgi:lipopolysaccharide assembly outer membrane protein LptD (OstA)